METEYSYNIRSLTNYVDSSNINLHTITNFHARRDSENAHNVVYAENQNMPTSPSAHVVDIDPLDLRFRILRQLLPHAGSELQEKDDILKFVLQYVKDLEQQIQNFNVGTDMATEGMGALQKKGLCIVDLSQFTKAF
ncbi:hypothetical protein GOP47_0023610 [Adiantum capillus-veneris]|uniref:BHLH domain-containing protein n=1 Tax=Adiantum capillus-veneris TaxID=13818 RepID=A0A9D4Z4P8_ADICA|nr:hypothetical protein GOP47_0023610 [Adiantum capillus-veneris]